MDYDVKKLLPHREPFLFIDEVLEVDEKSIVAKWFVSPDEDFFKGHFPDFPIMPGVLVLEAMAQSTGVLGSHIMKQTANKNSVYLLCGIEKTRFRKKVLPGDTLIFKSELITPIRRGIAHMQSYGYANGKLVVEAELMAKISKREE